MAVGKLDIWRWTALERKVTFLQMFQYFGIVIIIIVFDGVRIGTMPRSAILMQMIFRMNKIREREIFDNCSHATVIFGCLAAQILLAGTKFRTASIISDRGV